MLKIVQERIDSSQRERGISHSARAHHHRPHEDEEPPPTRTSTLGPEEEVPLETITSGEDDCIKAEAGMSVPDAVLDRVGAVAVTSRNSETATATTELFDGSANWTHSSMGEDVGGVDVDQALAIAAEVAPEMLELERSLTERIRSEILAGEGFELSRFSGSVTTVAEVVAVDDTHRKRRCRIAAMASCCLGGLLLVVALALGLVFTSQTTFDFPSNDTIIAHVPETICYERIPFLGRSKICPPEQQDQGSGPTQMVAESRLWNVPDAQISILNAGEVRVDIPQGNYTMGQAWELLPFYDNELVVLHLKGNKLITAMERGIQKLFDDQAAADSSLNSTTPSGAYPYGAGIRWNVNMTQSFPHRLHDIEINPRLSGAWRPIELHETYSIVTNSYLTGGGDSYHEFSSAEENSVVHTGLFSLPSFVDYCKAHRLLIKPPLEHFSTQTYIHDSKLFEIVAVDDAVASNSTSDSNS